MIHTKEKPFACPHCSHRSNQQANIRQHVSDVHLKFKRLKCHFCQKGFNHKNNLRFHMKVHVKDGHNIDQCSHCVVHLAWTPGRGKRAKQANAPTSLNVVKPKKKNRPAGRRQAADDSEDGECERPDEPSDIAVAVEVLFRRRRVMDKDWDQVMADIIARSQDADAGDDDEDDGYEDDEEEEMEVLPSDKHVRSQLFFCKILGCSRIFNEQETLDQHLAEHEEQRLRDKQGKAGRVQQSQQLTQPQSATEQSVSFGDQTDGDDSGLILDGIVFDEADVSEVDETDVDVDDETDGEEQEQDDDDDDEEEDWPDEIVLQIAGSLLAAGSPVAQSPIPDSEFLDSCHP